MAVRPMRLFVGCVLIAVGLRIAVGLLARLLGISMLF
jgi:hypothetical protein